MPIDVFSEQKRKQKKVNWNTPEISPCSGTSIRGHFTIHFQ
jgi:hypothetical protein